MDVAKQLFCEKGYEKTNLSDIADVAGVTRGAIYWYFQNKDDLFIELCKDMIDTDTNLFHLVEEVLTVELILDVQFLAFADGVESFHVAVGLKTVVNPYKRYGVGVSAHGNEFLL